MVHLRTMSPVNQDAAGHDGNDDPDKRHLWVHVRRIERGKKVTERCPNNRRTNRRTTTQEGATTMTYFPHSLHGIKRLVQSATAVGIALVLATGAAAAQTEAPTQAPSTDAATTPSAQNLSFDGVRDMRYCEIFVVAGQTQNVYNTTGVSDCPTAQWSTLTPSTVSSQMNASSAFLNGQRFWVPDQIVVQNTQPIPTSFNGVLARLWGSVDVPPSSGSSAAPPYTDSIVNRDSQWFYDAGKPVFELITNDSPPKVYVMQSYSHILDNQLTYDDLFSLNQSMIQIPDGWSYKVVIPTSPLPLFSINGEAHVLQDQLQNTYMLYNTPVNP
jgi:hypothetical protein